MDFAIIISEDRWEEHGDAETPWNRLMLPNGMTINRHHFHVEAIAVERTPNHMQVACGNGFDDALEHLHAFNGCDFETQTIRGREYVVVVTPHGS